MPLVDPMASLLRMTKRGAVRQFRKSDDPKDLQLAVAAQGQLDKMGTPSASNISSYEARKAYEGMQRADVAAKMGYRAGDTAAATGNVLNARQNLFKRMQAAGPAGAANLRKEAEALGVTSLGFDRALRNLGAQFSAAQMPEIKYASDTLANEPVRKLASGNTPEEEKNKPKTRLFKPSYGGAYMG